MDNEAAALARKRWEKAKRSDKTCPFCGRTYRGVREQVYCTPAHQQAAATRRVREKRRAAQVTQGYEATGLGPGIGNPNLTPQAGASRSALAQRPAQSGLSFALAEAERYRAADNLAEAEHWERIAAGIASSTAAAERVE